VFQDLTESKHREEKLGFLERRDLVTGLPNRQAFSNKMEQSLVRARGLGESLALFLLDLDNFKNINDTHGQATGDLYLKAVGQRLLSCVRGEDTVSRVSGDEFAILINSVKEKENAIQAARRISATLADPLDVNGKELYASASIGIAIFPSDGEDVETLLKNASLAVHLAKDQGKQNYQLYTPAMNRQATLRLELESSLRRAIARQEMRVYYQPMIDLVTGEVVGMEALVRWLSREKGLIAPGKFIPLAEETGLIVPIGEWMLMSSCQRVKMWHDAGFNHLKLSVNISARQLLWQHDLGQVVEEALAASGLPPSALELEMTESAVMHNVEAAIEAMSQLRAKGVRLSLDDFGTGYSSLNYLKRFPLDSLKIDRTFVKDVPHDPEGVAIVNGIIAMARSLDLQIIAEGVETEEQLDFVRANHCHLMQGFIFSKPLPEDEFDALLQRGARMELKK
jgi:diguanylate cyclase (GGDEF)-like protein